MKTMLIIGVGGIGSFLAREINRLILNDQISLDEWGVVVCDEDSVEVKNIKYQNFDKTDVFKNKARVIGDRYGFDIRQKRIIETKQLKNYDLIVSAVDNSATRKLIYDYCFSNDTYLIDLRSEGRAIAFFTKELGKEKISEFLKGQVTEEGTSCQLKYELDNGIIQNGNLIIATMGSQLILNHIRGVKNTPQLIMRV
jgi:molybdopterin/thiamine biosynthesis adenylyltransferase